MLLELKNEIFVIVIAILEEPKITLFNFFYKAQNILLTNSKF